MNILLLFSDDKQAPLNDPDSVTGFKDPNNLGSSSLAVNREDGIPTGSLFCHLIQLILAACITIIPHNGLYIYMRGNPFTEEDQGPVEGREKGWDSPIQSIM